MQYCCRCCCRLRTALGAYTAPPWACSPAPHASNPLCPGPARGDSRCSRQGCTPDAGCARQECNAVQGAISGTVVVQDAWLSIRGSSCKKTQWTLSECCALCQESPRCNAWSFCNDPNGCGTGCVARVHKHVAAETPVYTISPMTYTRRLNPEHSCTAAGAWPYGTCSLLYVDGPARPEAPPLMKGGQPKAEQQLRAEVDMQFVKKTTNMHAGCCLCCLQMQRQTSVG